jgi:exosortase
VPVPAQWSSKWTAHASALAFWLVSLILFRQPLSTLASLSFHDENSSHILLIPLISALLIFLKRKRVFRAPRNCPSVGVPLLLIAAALWYGLKNPHTHLQDPDRLSLMASLLVLVWIGTFILCYGTGAFQAAAFPMLFLVLMIPLPAVVLQYLVTMLQRGSAATSYGLFRGIGVPVIRHGFRFSLPGIDIEIAEQCSGIHSALSLFIGGLLLQHVLLDGTWRKVCFILCILPVAMLKNAVRIVTIAWLGIHVNADFFHGQLHRQGGLPFSFLAVAMLGLLLWLLKLPFVLLGGKNATGPLISGAVPAKS